MQRTDSTSLTAETTSPSTPAADGRVAGEEDALRRRARARVVAQTVYLAVVGAWVVLGAVQVLIWYLTTPGGYFWPVWPILGSVVAAIAWGIPTFVILPGVSERRIDAEVARLRAHRA